MAPGRSLTPSSPPVATRFLTYGVQLAGFGDHGVAAMYADSLLTAPEYLAWLKGAQDEG